MMTSPLDARGLRRALSAVAIGAGSLLLVAPVAGASAGEPPAAAAEGQAQAEANAPEAQGQEQAEAASQTGQDASAAGSANADERSDAGANEMAPPEHSNAGGAENDALDDENDTGPPADSNAGGNQTDAPNPNNGAANPEARGASGEHKQTICHRTRSATNPYVVITVDFHAVDGQIEEAHGQGDHAARHGGPVFHSDMTSGDVWGDIIPSFTTEWGSYDGLNWGPDGQATFENGCQLPETEDGDDGSGDDGEGENGEVPPVAEDDDEGNGDESPVVEEAPELPTDVEGDVVTRQPTPAAPDEEAANVGGQPTVEDTAVLGDVVTRPAAATGGAPVSTLARTGNATGVLAAAGAGLVGLGLLLVRGTRRVGPTR